MTRAQIARQRLAAQGYGSADGGAWGIGGAGVPYAVGMEGMYWPGGASRQAGGAGGGPEQGAAGMQRQAQGPGHPAQLSAPAYAGPMAFDFSQVQGGPPAAQQAGAGAYPQPAPQGVYQRGPTPPPSGGMTPPRVPGMPGL